MADETSQNTQVDDAAPAKKSGVLVWIVVSLLAMGSGFALPLLVMPSPTADPEAEETLLVANDEPPVFIEFEEVVVNLNEPRLNRYLRLKLSLMVDQSQKAVVEQKVEKNQTNLKSWLLSFLADKTTDDIRGGTGQNRLRSEIKNHFNSVLFPNGHQYIRSILFEEFNIQ